MTEQVKAYMESLGYTLYDDGLGSVGYAKKTNILPVGIDTAQEFYRASLIARRDELHATSGDLAFWEQPLTHDQRVIVRRRMKKLNKLISESED